MATTMPVGPTQPRLPEPSKFDFAKPEDLRAWAEELNQSLVTAMIARPAQTQPRPEMLLAAPNGDTYAVTIDNAGVVTTVLRNKVSA